MNTIRSAAAILAAVSAFAAGCDDRAPDEGAVQPLQISAAVPSALAKAPQSAAIGPKMALDLLIARGPASSTDPLGRTEEYKILAEVTDPRDEPLEFRSAELTFADGIGRRFGSPRQLSGEVHTLGKADTVIKHGQRAEFEIPTAPALPPTIRGTSFTEVSLQLVANGAPVTETYRGILPPLDRVPDSSVSASNWFTMKLWPEENVPSGSGVFGRQSIQKMLDQSAERSSNAVLAKVTPYVMRVKEFGPDSRMYLPLDWYYRFWSPDESFAISQSDSLQAAGDRCPKPSVALDAKMLRSCAVDFDAITMMLEEAGATNVSRGFVSELSARLVNGTPRPVWDIGYYLDGKKAYVLADTGQIVYLEDGHFKAFDVIWN